MEIVYSCIKHFLVQIFVPDIEMAWYDCSFFLHTVHSYISELTETKINFVLFIILAMINRK